MNLLKSFAFLGVLFLGTLSFQSCDKKEDPVAPAAVEHIGVSARIGNVDWQSAKSSAKIENGALVISASTVGKSLAMTVSGTAVGKYVVNASTDSKVVYRDSSYRDIKLYTSDVHDSLQGYIQITSIDETRKTISGKFSFFVQNVETGEILVLENGVINKVSYADSVIIDTTEVQGATLAGTLYYSSLDSSNDETISVTNGLTTSSGTRFVVEYHITATKTLRMEIQQNVAEGTIDNPTPSNNAVASFHLIEGGTIYSIADDANNNLVIDTRSNALKKITGSLNIIFDGEETIGETFRVNGDFTFVYP